MTSTTLNHYKDNYNNNLQLFLKEYEDNNESIFLKKEHSYYYNYLNVLIDISVLIFQKATRKNVESKGECFVCEKIKELNVDAYAKLFPRNPILQEINEDALNNLITSAKGIVDFIKLKQYNPQRHSEVHKDFYVNLNRKEIEVGTEIDWYPKIFRDKKSYEDFIKLYDDFGNTKHNLSNYSFIFRKMSYEGLIHPDLKHKSYYEFLSKFDISIDRIKSLSEMGNNTLRESIYSKVKSE